ncbi:MAG: molecular chaperone TorD family protein [Actinomycetota bacterium]
MSTTTLETPSVVAMAMRYPTPDSLTALTAAINGLPKGNAEREMRRFLKGIDGRELKELEELFTTTFDLTPVVTPYVGHLAWGDSYERGAFMADIQAAMRSAGVDPEGELPDHIEPILRYLAVTDDPIESLKPILVPAVTKMEKTLKKADSKNPYVHVLAATRIVAEEGMR